MGTGSNQDGRTKGITVPNGDAQVALMRSVYESNGLNPEDTAFVEAHGTGTKVGDPIEARALHEVFGKGRTARNPLYIGSVKANIGHLEGASGIVSVIKSALMLEKGMILPNTNFEKGNESIPFAEWNLKVPTSVRPWPRNKQYISVNNFGFGGTNAHVVLERAPLAKKIGVNGVSGAGSSTDTPPRRLFVLSGNDKQAVEKQVNALGIYLEQRPEVFQNALLSNLAYTLGQRRSHLPWKVALTATSSMDLVPLLASTDVVPKRSMEQPRIGFVFTGQGAQSARMGFELMAAYPVFKQTMEAADKTLKDIGATFSLIEELSRGEKESKISDAHLSQPACTAVQLALTDLLRSWGITPSAVAGHSSGEIGAAYAAGVLDLQACMAIAYHRGQGIPLLKKKYPDLKGTMMAVGAGPDEIRPLLKMLKNGKAVVACINSPSSITASGDEEAIIELQDLVEAKQFFNRRLRIETAYHSHHMELVADEYAEAIKDTVAKSTTEIAFHSSLLGEHISNTEALDASYWVQNLTKPVRFAEALASMVAPVERGSTKPGVDVVVELGPHSALEGPCKQILKAVGGNAAKIPYASALLRKTDACLTATKLAGTLFCTGAAIDLAAINFPDADKSPALLTDLPKYPWNHNTRYWHESRIALKHCHRESPRRDILGTLANYSNDLEPTWRNQLKVDDMPWLSHHKMQNMTVYPMAGYMAMAMEAAAQRAVSRDVKFDKFELREITVSRPLIIPEGASVESNITLRSYTEGTRMSSDYWDEFRVFSWAKEKGWIEHCRGLIATVMDKTNVIDGARQVEDARNSLITRMSLIEKNSTIPIEPAAFYAELEAKGAGYGSTFQSMEKCRGDGGHAVAELVVPDTAAEMPLGYETDHIVHPGFLDQFIQIVWPIFGAGRQSLDVLYMPSFVQSMSMKYNIPKTPGDRLKVWGTGNPTPATPKATKLDLFATTIDGGDEAIISMESLVMTPVFDGAGDDGSFGPRELCYKTEWDLAFKTASEKEDEQSESMTAPQVDSVDATSDIDVAIVSNGSTQQELVSALLDGLRKLTSKTPEVVALSDVLPGQVCIFLEELEKPVLKDISPSDFDALRTVITESAGAIWPVKSAYITSTNPEANMVTGMARSIRSETLLKFATVDLSANISTIDTAKTISEIFKQIFVSGSAKDMEYLERNGELFVPRVKNDDVMNRFVHQETQDNVAPDMQPFKQPGRSLKIAIETAGALDTLYFTDDLAVGTPLPDYEVEIKVKATSMNFKDIMVTMGQLSQPYIGVECAGIISGIGSKVTDLKIGDRVTAMSEGAYSTHTRCLGTSVQKIANSMTFEDASTIPVIFCTAYYSLFDLGRLQKGERILIHAAAGGVGQAAIMLAKMVGAEVFATVGSLSKKNHLITEYGIPEDHIFYSRDISFAKAVKRATDGEGVDVVLNSLAGNLLRETWDCLAHFGRFIEIGKRDIVGNTRLEMARFEHNAMFASVDLTVVAAERPKIMKRLLKDVFELLDNKTIKPISPITVFPLAEVESAFRTLQGGKIMGKIVLVPGEDDQVRAIPSKVSNKLLQADATYILLGGTGGLGRSMAKWMVSKGARNLVLISRSGSAAGKVAELIEEAKEAGANIIVKACDASDETQVHALIKGGLCDLPPIRGIIHGAMVLDDVLFEKMTYEQWSKVIASKVPGAWNFHNAFSASETPLDFFITISSAAGAVGNRGQAAYAAANVFLNAFCQYRNNLGLPACSIDLTAVSDVGYLADDKEKAAEVAKNLGGDTINEKEVLALIAAGITGKLNKECNGHTITGLKIGANPDDLFWSSDAKFTYLLEAALAAHASNSSAGATVSLSTAVKNAPTFEAAAELVQSGLLTKVSSVLMVPQEEMDPSSPIVKYGLDSLVAIEIRNWITRELEASLQVLELLTSSSITALAEAIVVKSKLSPFTEKTKAE